MAVVIAPIFVDYSGICETQAEIGTFILIPLSKVQKKTGNELFPHGIGGVKLWSRNLCRYTN